MSFAKNPQNINRGGRPKGKTPSTQIRKAIQERIDVGQLFDEIEELPKSSAVRFKVELLQFVLPRLKSIETPNKTLQEYISIDLSSGLSRLTGVSPIACWASSFRRRSN